jgi:hypothetical protein
MSNANIFEEPLDFAIWATKAVPGDIPVNKEVLEVGNYVFAVARAAALWERERIINIIDEWTAPDQGSANLHQFRTVLIDEIHETGTTKAEAVAWVKSLMKEAK